jgi:hypothetical protein
VINNMNPLIANTGTTERSSLVEQLARRADGNRDGQVTSAEFSTFLANLMQSLDSEQAAQRESEAPGAPASAGVQTTTVLPGTDGAALTRAQGAALLRQAFEPVARSR